MAKNTQAQEQARQLYIKWSLASNDDEEEELFRIREWYEGRQFPEGLGEREQYVAPTLVNLLNDYPMLNLLERTVRVLNERIRLKKITCPTNEAWGNKAMEWWKSARLGSWQTEIYEAALRDKACVVIVEWDYENDRPVFYKNELWDGYGGSCRIHYDDNDQVIFVSKKWVEVDDNDIATGNTRITLYFPDRIERYVSEGGSSARLLTSQELKDEYGYALQNPQPWVDGEGKPMGIAAVVFENVNYVSECASVIAAQSGLNESILDWHTSARYHGIPTVVFEGVSFRIDPKTGKDVEPEWTPGKGIAIDDGKVIRLQAADISSLFEGAVMPWIKVVSLQKGWPMHVFTQMPPSGETLRQMESPLVIQCDDKKISFEDSWRDLFELGRKMHYVVNGEWLDGDLEFEWTSSVSLNELYEARVRQTNARAMKVEFDQAKLSAKEVMRRMGLDDKAIERVYKEYQAQLDADTDRKIRIEEAKKQVYESAPLDSTGNTANGGNGQQADQTGTPTGSNNGQQETADNAGQDSGQGSRGSGQDSQSTNR